MKLKTWFYVLLSSAVILTLSSITQTPAQVARSGGPETPHEAVSSEGGGDQGVVPKRESGGKNQGPDTEVSSQGEGGEAALVSESFEGEGGAGTIEMVQGFNSGEAFREAYKPSREEADQAAALQKELQEAPPIEKLLFKDLPETICGNDARVRVTPTTPIPWRWNCQLLLTLKGGAKARATGWFIGPCTVMTAGHCVHTGKGGDWMQSIQVIPAMDGTVVPYGSQTSSNFRSVKGWTDPVIGGQVEYDYGAIILPNGTLGNKVGWFGFAVLTDSQLTNLTVNTAGYPGDKPTGTQWFTAGPITSVEARRLGYMLDTYPGQSGSAVWRLQNNQRHGVGVHNYGGCPNHATRITQDVFNNMLNWKNICK